MDRRRLIVLVVWTLAWSFGSVARSGPLTPPGAPAPTMKTLNEVEARIPIGPLTTPGDANAVYVISQPGSYYLTGDVQGVAGKSGILIGAESVTLDLNGYALVGASGSLHGVVMFAFVPGVEIRNGVVRNWGQSGVLALAENGRIRDLRIYNCGRWGIDVAGSLLPRIEDCAVYSCGGIAGVDGGGIRSTGDVLVRGCTVYSASGAGIATLGLVSNCLVEGVTADSAAGQSGVGIQGFLVESSMARLCANAGIRGERLIRGCVSNSNGAQYIGVLVIDSN